jgi:Beta-glucan synthesis-associated protein SKN1/KRE6/Sbg1
LHALRSTCVQHVLGALAFTPSTKKIPNNTPISSPISPFPHMPYPPATTSSFVSSPLNPTSNPVANGRSSQADLQESAFADLILSPSLIGMNLASTTPRGSMILYRLASDDGKESIPSCDSHHHHLLPPPPPPHIRNSAVSSLRSSFISMDLDDPFWEAVDIWYGARNDLKWHDPQQITTCNGQLVITMDSTSITQAGLTPGPFRLMTFPFRVC